MRQNKLLQTTADEYASEGSLEGVSLADLGLKHRSAIQSPTLHRSVAYSSAVVCKSIDLETVLICLFENLRVKNFRVKNFSFDRFFQGR